MRSTIYSLGTKFTIKIIKKVVQSRNKVQILDRYDLRKYQEITKNRIGFLRHMIIRTLDLREITRIQILYYFANKNQPPYTSYIPILHQ